MTPIMLLEAELDKWKRALEKLEEMFKTDLIPENVYNERKENLKPKISKYTEALRILTFYMDWL